MNTFRYLPFIAVIPLISCSIAQRDPLDRPQVRTSAEVAFVKGLFNTIQPRSIAENREYCGYVGVNAAGAFEYSGPRRGGIDGCVLPNPPNHLQVLASYHTHAAYVFEYDNEVPSTNDLAGDIDDGVDGYIATPGGRVWFNNALTGQAILLCDIDCVTADPNFVRDVEFPISAVYTITGLEQRQN